jgi:asparagine synthase (glutamine-hydrolysing)
MLPRTDREVHEHTFAGDDDATSLVLEEIDHLGMRSGVEHRHPFYDVRLIELCVALPARLKLNDGWPRYVLRAAMDGLLPESIRLRSDKADLSPNFQRNLFRYGQSALTGLLDEPLIAPFIDRTALRAALDRFDAVAAWHALALARWLDHVSSVTASAAPIDAPGRHETVHSSL